MRILSIILSFLFVCNLSAQVDPEQIFQAPARDYVLLSLDTNNSSYPINGIYQPMRLRDSLYYKTDSLCHGIFGDGRKDPCVPVDDLGCITVIYGGGDSTRTVCLGDTMFIDYGEPGMGGGPGDTTYYWIYTTDGGAPDTVTIGEVINFVAGTNITITQGATNLTFDVPNMRDTCRHTLTQLTDSTAQLTDCLGANRGIINFNADACLQDLIVENGAGNDTVFLTYCDGTPKDTIVVYHATFNDSYADSAGVWNNDTVMVYRVDTSGIIDSFSIVVPLASLNDTIYQSFAIDTTAAEFTLSDDPTATPDLLILPFKDAINDDFSANYIDKIRHNNYVGINTFPSHTLDIRQDTFNLAAQRIYSSLGVAAIRLEDSSFADKKYYDIGMGSGAFFLKQKDPGISTGRILIEVDSGASERALRLIGPSENNGVQMQDYGQGNYLQDIAYVTGWSATGKLREFSFASIVDSVAPNIDLTHIDQAIDSIQLDSYPNLREKLVPWQLDYAKEDSIITNSAAWDSLRLMNDAARWMYLEDGTKGLAWGEGARADFVYSSAYGYNSFPLLQDTFPVANETVLSSQIDTVNERVTGLSTWIAHLIDSLGYTVGQNIVINVTLNSGQMPFVDSAVYMAEGLTVFNIASTSTLAPVYFEFDSIETGSYNFITHIRYDSSTAIGAFAMVDRPNQVAIGSDSLREVKMGDFIRIKADTFYTNLQVMAYDSILNQIVPVDLGGGYDFAHGSVIWWDTTGNQERFQEDSLKFYWHKDSAYLAVGHRTPVHRLHVVETSNFKPNIAMFEQTGPGHAAIQLKAGSGNEWTLVSRFEDIFRISSAAGVVFEANNAATTGFGIESDNLVTMAAYGDGTFQSHLTDLGNEPFNSSEITYMAGWDVSGDLKEMSFDSLASRLSVAVSTPDITQFEVEEDDSLALELSGIELAKADLSMFRVLISGDTLYQGDSINIFPQGGDSLGRVAGTGEIIISNGVNKYADSDTVFVWTSTNRLGLNTASPEWPLHVATAGNAILIENSSHIGAKRSDATTHQIFSFDNNNDILFNRSSVLGAKPPSSVIFIAGAARYFDVRNSSNSSLLRVDEATGFTGINTTTPDAQLNVDGTVRLDNLGAVGAIANVLYVDAENDVGEASAADLKTFIGATDATAIANTHVAFSNGTSLIGEANFTYDATDNAIQVDELEIISNDGLFYESAAATNAWRTWQATDHLYYQPQTTDGLIYFRDVAGGARFSMNFLTDFFFASNLGVNTTSSTYAFDVNGTSIFRQYAQFLDGIRDASGDDGDPDEILKSDGTDIYWAPNTNATITLSGDVTGSGTTSITTSIGSAVIVEADLNATNSPTDNYILSYNAAGSNFTWVPEPAGGADELGTVIGVGNIVYGDGTDVADQESVFYYTEGTNALTIDNLVFDGNVSGVSTSTVSTLAHSITATSLTLTGTTGTITMDSNGETTVNDDMRIGGGSLPDQLRIRANPSYVWVGHEDHGITTAGIIFRDNTSTDLELYADSELVIDITGATVAIAADALIGDQGGYQLEINTTSTSEVWIGEEDNIASTPTSANSNGMRFEEDGDIRISNFGTGDDISIQAQDVASFGGATTVLGKAGGEVYLGTFKNGLGAVSGASVECDVFGDIEYTGSLTPVSDRRLKKNIISISNPYEKIMALKPVSFNMIEDNVHKYGYIAQEYKEVFEDQVKVTDPETGFLGIMDGAATTYTTAAVQQLIKDKEQMQRTIDDMRDVITSQEDRLLKLEKMILKK